MAGGLVTGVTGVSGVDGIIYKDIGDPTSALLMMRPFCLGQVQAPAFATPLNIDLTLGTVIEPGLITSSFTVTLVGNTVQAPGLFVLFIFVHDNTANVYTITWPANFKKNFTLTNTALSIDAVGFVSDGGNFAQCMVQKGLA